MSVFLKRNQITQFSLQMCSIPRGPGSVENKSEKRNWHLRAGSGGHPSGFRLPSCLNLQESRQLAEARFSEPEQGCAAEYRCQRSPLFHGARGVLESRRKVTRKNCLPAWMPLHTWECSAVVSRLCLLLSICAFILNYVHMGLSV